MAVTDVAWPQPCSPSGRPSSPRAVAAGAASSVPRAVWLLGAGHQHQLHVITVASVSIVEVDPVTVAVAVCPGSRILDLIAVSGAFTAGLLAGHQSGLADRFARPGRPFGSGQLAGLGWSASPATGSPLLDGMHVWFDCELTGTVDLAGSVLLAGTARAGSGPPAHSAQALLRLGGRYLPVPSRTRGHAEKGRG